MSKLPYPSAGQRVVCIDDDWISSICREGLTLPEKGKVYTISGMFEKGGNVYLYLLEIPLIQFLKSFGAAGDVAFIKDSFRPVVDSDISDLLALRNPKPNDVGRIQRYDAATRERWRSPSREKVDA
jgi:hypothetical protein